MNHSSGRIIRKLRSALLMLSSAMLLLPLPSALAATTLAVSAKFLQKALHRNGPLAVLQTLPGPSGLTAALISADRHKGIVWVIGDDSAVAVGDIRDAKGEDLTKQMAIRMGLLPKPIAPAAVAKAVSKLDTFALGSTGPEITVFVDPNCIFCHDLYVQAQPLIRAGTLRLRVVMVGFLKPTSFDKAAAILMRSDRAEALATDETTFDIENEEGGIKPAKAVPTAIKQAVQNNTQLLSRSGAEATPTLLFQDKAGEWQIMHHLPTQGFAPILAQMKK
jgi:thiol:disulfide interchange protein DsbG